jgi:hypothetical protein
MFCFLEHAGELDIEGERAITIDAHPPTLVL